MNQKQISASYKCIDVFRFVLAFFVIVIHYPPFAGNEWFDLLTKDCIARLSVPCYFIISGFFLFREEDDRQHQVHRLENYAFRILHIYIIWTIIYLPIVISRWFIPADNTLRALVLWLKDCLFYTSYSHLWYLNATITASLILALLQHFKLSIKKILFAAFILYCVGLLPQTYFGVLKPFLQLNSIYKFLKLVQKIILTTRNGLFEGLLFMTIGALLSQYRLNVLYNKYKTLLLPSIVLLALEVIVLHKLGWDKERDMYLFLVPTSMLLLIFVGGGLEAPTQKDTRPLRSIGSLIYFIHPLIGYAIQNWTGNSMMALSSPMLYLTVSTVSLLIAFVLYKLSQFRGTNWLKYLYK